MVNEASACHPTWGPADTPPASQEEEGRWARSQPREGRGRRDLRVQCSLETLGLVNHAPTPGEHPCPLSTLLLQLMPSQSMARPRLHGDLLLLGPLKA